MRRSCQATFYAPQADRVRKQVVADEKPASVTAGPPPAARAPLSKMCRSLAVMPCPSARPTARTDEDEPGPSARRWGSYLSRACRMTSRLLKLRE